MESRKPNEEKSKLEIWLRRVLIGLISLGEMTSLFIHLKSQTPNSIPTLKTNFEKLNLHKMTEFIETAAVTPESAFTPKSFEVDPTLLEADLDTLLMRFSPSHFQAYLFLSGLRFPKSEHTQVTTMFHPQLSKVARFEFSVSEQKSLFTSQKKRKDDMMSSLLKYNQRRIINAHKNACKLRLMRQVKEDFRQQFFAGDVAGERVFYSNLFNRRDIGNLAGNRALMKEMGGLYRLRELEEVVEKYCFDRNQTGWFGNKKKEKLFSEYFVNQLGKKPMRLQDVLYSFYGIEKLLASGLYEKKRRSE